MRNKWFVLVLAVVLALAFGSQALAQDPVVLRVWTGSSSPAENAFKEAQFAAFEEANPDIDLEVLISPDYGTQIQAGFASGDYPEVFTVGQFDLPSLVDSGLLAAGTDKIENPDDIYPALREAFTVDGTLYCPAKDFSTLAVFYNKDYFEQAGLEAPTSDWTWDDMYAAAEAITNADIKTSDGADVVGFSAGADRNRWLALFQANGAKLFDDNDEVAFDSPEAVEALTYYRSFVENGVGDVPSNLGGAGWNGEAFGRGLAAMTIEGNWAIGYLNTDFPELNWGVVEIPVAPNGGRGTLLFTECWAVSSQVEGTDKEEAAWKLVNFLTGEQGALANAEAGFGVMPSRASAADAWLQTSGEDLAPFVNGAEYAWAPVFPLGYGDFTTAVDEGTTGVMDGSLTPEEALQNAAEIAREIKAEGM
ncbi:MAG: ABC transporter substrate-binding protein [Anaerolineae bacterium]|nr:ABC transporter substrate-binding protein [Anaerolineae bacterium]